MPQNEKDNIHVEQQKSADHKLKQIPDMGTHNTIVTHHNLPSAHVLDDDKHSHSSDEGLDIYHIQHRSTFSVIMRTFTACLGAFYFGFALAYLNMAQKKLDYVFDINENQKSLFHGLISGAMPLGGGFGCYVAGFLMKIIGRRQIFLLTDVIQIGIASLMLVPSVYAIIAARFLLGIFIGVNSTVIPLYIRETTPPPLTSITGVFNQANVKIGVVTAYALGFGFPLDELDLERQSDFWWQFILAYVPMIACGTRFLLMMTVYRRDTPQYYISKGDEQMAKEALLENYDEKNINVVLHQLQKDVKASQGKKETWGQIFSKEYFPRLLVGLCAAAANQLSGINIILFYSSVIFKSVVGDYFIAKVLTLCSGIVQMAVAFYSGSLGKRYGRKQLILTGQVGMAVCLAIIGILSYILRAGDNVILGIIIVVLIMVHLVFFNIAIGPYCWVYNSDILNDKGYSFATSLNWCCSFFVAFTFPILEGPIGLDTQFLLYAGLCMLLFVFFKRRMLETKGLTQEEIKKLDFSAKKSN